MQETGYDQLMWSGRESQELVRGGSPTSPLADIVPLRSELAPRVDTRLFRHEFTPTWLGTAAILAGVRPPDLTRPFCATWLGCGGVYTPVVAAAVHPEANVVAWDPDPARLSMLRRIRDDAQIPNLVVHEDPEPPGADRAHASDIVVVDGLLDSVDGDRRQQVVGSIARLLRPGGFVVASYRTVVGWGEIAPVVQVMRHFALRSSSDPAESVASATALLAQLSERGVRYIHERPAVKVWLDELVGQSPAEIVEQYVNRHLHPVSHAQIVESLSEIGATYVGSARPDPDVTVELSQQAKNGGSESDTATVRKLIKQLRDAKSSVLAETLADLALRRANRIDLFCLGPTPVPTRTRTVMLKRLRFSGFERHDDWAAPGPDAVAQHSSLVDALPDDSVSVAEMWPTATPRQREDHLRRALRAGILHPAAEPPAPEALAAAPRLSAVLSSADVPIAHRCTVAPTLGSAVPLTSAPGSNTGRRRHLEGELS